jgi:Domain of unknown function (DUF4157)
MAMEHQGLLGAFAQSMIYALTSQTDRRNGQGNKNASRSAVAARRSLQRKCACGGSGSSGGECQECNKKKQTLQCRAASGVEPRTVPPIVHDALRSPGQPLDRGARAAFESHFGHDFGRVRIHTDDQAAESARAVNALAYTVGQHIVFAAGRHNPTSPAGRKLLAHELTHVVQQERSSESSALRLGSISNPHEREAASASATLGDGAFNSVEQASGLVQRQDGDTPPPAPDAASAPAPTPSSCTPGGGISPSTCSAYLLNSWWLPLAYVNNATCACSATPDVPTANCVRKTLQDKLAATPGWLKALAAAQKPLELDPLTYTAYQLFVQTMLTPRIYDDHVSAYRACCCPSGPAAYPDWMAVTLVPVQPCSLVGWFIDHFGSCSGTPGAW